jgi:hypothetical protein
MTKMAKHTFITGDPDSVPSGVAGHNFAKVLDLVERKVPQLVRNAAYLDSEDGDRDNSEFMDAGIRCGIEAQRRGKNVFSFNLDLPDEGIQTRCYFIARNASEFARILDQLPDQE